MYLFGGEHVLAANLEVLDVSDDLGVVALVPPPGVGAEVDDVVAARRLDALDQQPLGSAARPEERLHVLVHYVPGLAAVRRHVQLRIRWFFVRF